MRKVVDLFLDNLNLINEVYICKLGLRYIVFFSGYGFNNDKAGPSLLGNPGAMLGGPRGPVDRMQPGGPPRGFPQQSLLSRNLITINHLMCDPNALKYSLLLVGPGGNQFPRPGFMGVDGPPPSAQMTGPRSWFDAPNPFLNPNPFAGNPFVQSSLSENPFDIGVPPPSSDGPPPLFGQPRALGGGQPDRNLFETTWGSGDDNNRGGGGRPNAGGGGDGFMRGGGANSRGRGGRDNNDKGGWWNRNANEGWDGGDEPTMSGGWGRGGRKPWDGGDRDDVSGGPPFGRGSGGRNSTGSEEGECFIL